MKYFKNLLPDYFQKMTYRLSIPFFNTRLSVLSLLFVLITAMNFMGCRRDPCGAQDPDEYVFNKLDSNARAFLNIKQGDVFQFKAVDKDMFLKLTCDTIRSGSYTKQTSNGSIECINNYTYTTTESMYYNLVDSAKKNSLIMQLTNSGQPYFVPVVFCKINNYSIGDFGLSFIRPVLYSDSVPYNSGYIRGYKLYYSDSNTIVNKEYGILQFKDNNQTLWRLIQKN